MTSSSDPPSGSWDSRACWDSGSVDVDVMVVLVVIGLELGILSRLELEGLRRGRVVVDDFRECVRVPGREVDAVAVSAVSSATRRSTCFSASCIRRDRSAVYRPLM